jgi:PAS domain S-box-containing protein
MRLMLFAIAIAMASFTPSNATSETQQALIWLPSGVAVAGLALIGWRAAWIIAPVILCQRLLLGNCYQVAIGAAASASAEALLGAWLLNALQVRRGCDRLRDVMAIYLVAAAAPLASIAVAAVSRLINGTEQGMAALTGMVGWWRMNAIGILVVLPLALSWPAMRNARAWLRPLGQAMLWGCLAALVATSIAIFGDPGMTSIILLGALPMICFAAALKMGSRDSSSAAFVGVVMIALPAQIGFGPFQDIPPGERHVVAQMVLVGLAALSPLFGALLAERDANAARWLQSEGLGHALLSLLPDATYRLRADGTIIDAVFPEGSPLPPPEQAIGQHIRDICPTTLGDRVIEQLNNLQHGEPTEILEHPLATRAGRRDHEMRFVRLPNAEALCVSRDITARKRADRQLNMQASILEMIASGKGRSTVFAALIHGAETLIPDGLCSILILHGDRLHVAAAPSLPSAYNELIDGFRIGINQGACGTAAATGCVVICSDVMQDVRFAAYRDVVQRFGLRACWSVPIRATDGSVLGTFAIYHDHVREPQPFEIGLIERAAVLAGLTIESERREGLLASIHQNVNEGLFRAVPDEGFAYVNTAFANMFGYESADHLRELWQLTQHAEHGECLQQLVAETQSLRSRKKRMVRRDGSEFWALISTSVTFDDNETELICDGTVSDISSHKELEDQLRQSQKMEAVGQLAGGVAHDFNNLLTAIIGFAETVNMELPEGDPLSNDVNQILEAARRASGLTRQLLAFGRQQVLSPEVLELFTVVTDLRELMGRLIGEHINLQICPEGPSARAKVDRGQLEQVILNLVINSRDAMQKGGTITIVVATVDVDAQDSRHGLEPGKYAVLRVEDTGCGMTSEVHARAFDPFFTTKALGVGTGLGLSTVYGIVKQSGGTVVIDSLPAQGTTMSVYLPFVDELPIAEPTVMVPRKTNRAGTILVVEDEPFVLELAQRTLRNAGHEVLLAKDGREALRVFREHHGQIDMVLSDIVMPNLSGPELVEQLRELRPELRVLFMSGYARDAIDLPPEVNQRTAFLHKPFSTSQLTEQVDIMLADKDPTQSPQALRTTEAKHPDPSARDSSAN